MFVMFMALTFKVGDTATVRINGEAATLTWRDERTLVINGTDARYVVDRRLESDGKGGQLRAFTCADAGEGPATFSGVIIGAGPQG